MFPKMLHSPSPVLKGSSIQKTFFSLSLPHILFSPKSPLSPLPSLWREGRGRLRHFLHRRKRRKENWLGGGGGETFQTKAFFLSPHFPTNSNSSGSRDAKGWLNAKGEQRARRALHSPILKDFLANLNWLGTHVN